MTGGSRSPSAYVPDRGDLIWLTFDPQAGREQAGRRPALVVSPANYNERARLVLVCPITSQIRGYPFEVLLPGGLPIGGAILADHLRSLDWQVRQATHAGAVPAPVLDAVLRRIAPLLGFR